ncbi:hypothetical protein Ciccas_011994 [Cichlidogyrus casuarinus]|uniref:Uncharacterized protein n=1 Tax=Cichlidogyrus casuarinus TaxID=1844966 RepID=A0ABD2PQJ7_9PLAT
MIGMKLLVIALLIIGPVRSEDQFKVSLENTAKLINTSQVEGNAFAFYFTPGMKLDIAYRITVYSVTNMNGVKQELLIGHKLYSFKTHIYYQDAIDRLARSVAENLGNSTQVLAELSLPWSNPMQKLTVVISNDADMFRGGAGRKYADYYGRSRESCKEITMSTAKCWQFTLKQGPEDHYTFHWPHENVAGLNVQLRFYLQQYSHGWYASELYPLDTGTQNSRSSLWWLFILLIIPIALGMGFFIRKIVNARRFSNDSSTASSLSSAGSN